MPLHHPLLITGAGGQGKTALAGQLARKLEQQGFLVHAYSARLSENSWENFIFHLKSSLTDQLLEAVVKICCFWNGASLLSRNANSNNIRVSGNRSSFPKQQIFKLAKVL